MGQILALSYALTLCSTAYAMVPPHPCYGEPPENLATDPDRDAPKFAPGRVMEQIPQIMAPISEPAQKSTDNSQNILAVMVSFGSTISRGACVSRLSGA
jgi:hypothetical protein